MLDEVGSYVSNSAVADFESSIKNSPEKDRLSLFPDQYRVTGNNKKMTFDIFRLNEAFSELNRQTSEFCTGSFGSMFSDLNFKVGTK